MTKQLHAVSIAVYCATVAIIAGCGGPQTGENTGRPAAAEETHRHAHPTEGPHGGNLIELGDEAYHAELVHDESAGTVTIYILDSAVKAAVPIDAGDVTINMQHDGRREQFKLAAAADQNDPQGKSSRFVTDDAELAEMLDAEHAEGQLVVTINGKQYRGRIIHDHEHGNGHEHDH